MAKKKLGFVYFVGAMEFNRVKIGFSLEKPDLRFSILSTASPVELTKLGLIRGGMKKEREIQRRFKQYRLHREWFELSDTIREFIKATARDWDEVVRESRKRLKPISLPEPARYELPLGFELPSRFGRGDWITAVVREHGPGADPNDPAVMATQIDHLHGVQERIKSHQQKTE